MGTGMSNPTVSVVMPVYNGENYLRLALESVLCQTFEDFEIILIDDGSEDSTPDITQSFGDDRVRYVRQENAGVAVAVNHGISLARGRYFAWLSHDDLWTPEKLSEQLQALQGAGPAVCYTDMKLIDGEGKLFEERELPLPERRELVRAILMGQPVSMAAYSLVCELRCFEQVGLYDVKKRYTQDADMLLRLARTFPFVRVPEKLTLVRDHGTRGTKRPEFVAEADAFFRAWLDALTPVELSASPSAFGRAMSRKEIADEYLSRATQPWTGLARNQYLKAVGESPLSLPVVLGSFLVHYFHLHRYMYRLGLRTYLRRRLGPVLKRTFAPVREESRKDDADQDCV
jgi:glycosyltransferase involved in cell wall biosynthesis